MTKKRKASMKTKRSWRKNISTTEFEGFLDKKLESERVGDVTKLKNADLFHVDVERRILSKKERKEIMKSSEPRCFEVLRNRSSVPDPISKRNVRKLGVRCGKIDKKSGFGGRGSKKLISNNSNSQKLITNDNNPETMVANSDKLKNSITSSNGNSEDLSMNNKSCQNVIVEITSHELLNQLKTPNPPMKVPKLSRSVPKKRSISSRFSELAKKKVRSSMVDEEVKFDVWTEEQNVNEETWISKDTQRHTYGPTRRKMPPSLKQRASQLPAIEEPHPGASYNPSYDDHQSLLRAVAEKELEEKKKEDHLIRVTSKMFKKVTPKENDANMLRELSEGLPILENLKHIKTQKQKSKQKSEVLKKTNISEKSLEKEELEDSKNCEDKEAENPKNQENLLEENLEDSEEEKEKGEGNAIIKKVVKNEKKTKKQRRKQREEREAARLRLAEREGRRRVADVYRLKFLEKQMQKDEKRREALREKRMKVKALKATEPKVLSKTKFEPADPEFQLSEELAGSLRATGPTGNLLKDRFKSLQRRNIVAPSTIQLKITKAKVKRYIKPDHKIDLPQLKSK